MVQGSGCRTVSSVSVDGSYHPAKEIVKIMKQFLIKPKPISIIISYQNIRSKNLVNSTVKTVPSLQLMLMLYDISIVNSHWCTVGLGMPDTVTRGVPVFGLTRKLEAGEA